MNESLLPTRAVLQGGEVLRVVGTDGKPMRLPLSALLDAAEARFATNSAEAAQGAGLWTALNALIARVVTLEARPVVSIAGLATQSSVNTVASAAAVNAADIATLRTSLNSLTARVTALEGEIKLKKDK
jgi:hypothetical protein